MPIKKKSPVKKPKVAIEPADPGLTASHSIAGPESPTEEHIPPQQARLDSDSARQVVEVVEEVAPAAEPPTKDESQVMGEERTQPAVEEAQEEVKEEVRKEMIGELFDGKNALPLASEISVHQRSPWLSGVLWVAVVLGVAILTGGGLYILMRRPQFSLPFSVAKPTPTPTPTPTPEAPQVARADISIQVLNGGGTPGSAGKMKEFLEEKGYTVADTGNTDEYTHETTEILVKPGREAYIPLLEEDLKDSYTLGTTSGTIAEDSVYDIQIIVGKE